MNVQLVPLDAFEVIEKQKAKLYLQPPSMYKVLLLNDDFTPMEFVVAVLQKFFQKDLINRYKDEKLIKIIFNAAWNLLDGNEIEAEVLEVAINSV